MQKILYWAALSACTAIFSLGCFAVGTIYGIGHDAESLRKFWFELFGLLGSWLSGIGALLAAYVALNIADKQRSDSVLHESIRSLHHSMAIIKDLHQRVVYVRKIIVEGGRPLAALTGNSAGIMRRYESLYDRDPYATLPGPIIDRIGDLSGHLFGIEATIAVISSSLGNKAETMVPARAPAQGMADPFEKLFQELDDLFTALDSERKRLSMK